MLTPIAVQNWRESAKTNNNNNFSSKVEVSIKSYPEGTCDTIEIILRYVKMKGPNKSIRNEIVSLFLYNPNYISKVQDYRIINQQHLYVNKLEYLCICSFLRCILAWYDVVLIYSSPFPFLQFFFLSFFFEPSLA